MTLLNDLMTNYEFDPVLAVPSIVAGLSLVLAGLALLICARVRRLLRVLPALEERVDVLNHSLTLLTDTTESCFKALSMQLQFMQGQNALRRSPGPDAIVRPRRPAANKSRGSAVSATRRRDALVALAASQNAGPSLVTPSGDAQSASIVSTFVA
jgi:hypothetical protein